MNALDYYRSFVTFVTPNRGNNARLQIESRCILTDTRTQSSKEYCFFASCKSERTFAEKDLFQQENYDFCGIFGGDEYVIFRAGREWSDKYLDQGNWSDRFDDLVWHLREASGEQLLTTNQEIVEASIAGHPLIGRTTVSSGDGSRQAVLEFPIKTMNANDIRVMYQVDTGPIPFPELDGDFDLDIKRFRLAFVAYNVPDFADFVLQVKTPVREGEPASIPHYSEIRSLKAENQVLRVD